MPHISKCKNLNCSQCMCMCVCARMHVHMCMRVCIVFYLTDRVQKHDLRESKQTSTSHHFPFFSLFCNGQIDSFVNTTITITNWTQVLFLRHWPLYRFLAELWSHWLSYHKQLKAFILIHCASHCQHSFTTHATYTPNMTDRGNDSCTVTPISNLVH